MRVPIEKVLSEYLVSVLYGELRESPLKVARKGRAEGLVSLVEKFNNRYYPLFTASLIYPNHRSNTYTVKIYTEVREDINSVEVVRSRVQDL